MTAVTRTRLAGALVALALFLSSGVTHAITAWTTDCFGVMDKKVFNQGDPVCYTGEVDKVPPGQICGAAYAFVTPAGSPNPFFDVSKGGANYITTCGGAGGFYDEYVWLPPLKPGTYEIVLDQYPFFTDTPTFGPEDWRSGPSGYFTVSNAPIVFSVDPQKIKDAAKEGLELAHGIEHLAHLLEAIDVLSSAAEWAHAFESLWGGVAYLALFAVCKSKGIDCPTSYNAAVIAIGNRILLGIAEAQALHYSAIIADPPDPSFDAPVPLDLAAATKLAWPLVPQGDDDLVRAQIHAAQLMATQVAAYAAIVPTLEKVQGASQAMSPRGLLIQSEKLKAYAELVVASGDAMLAEVDALEKGLAAAGVLGKGPDGATVKTAIDDAVKNGFAPGDEALLRSFGFGDADIALAKDEIAKLVVPMTVDTGALLADVRKSFETMRPAVLDLAAQAEMVRAENEPNATRNAPKVTLAQPAAGTVGVTLSLEASATHDDPAAVLSYAWDTDLDGDFDDGTGAKLDFVPTAPGKLLVAVKASDAGGAFDVAHAAVDVAIGNHRPPAIIAVTPADPAPFAEVGETIAFKVEAGDADGGGVNTRWIVDGNESAIGPELAFTMPDEEPHRISVIVSDPDELSPDARAHITVRAAKWKGVASGAGGSSGAGGPGAGGGQGDTGKSEAGCGCRVGPPARFGALLAAMALALALAARRVRARRGPRVRRMQDAFAVQPLR
jgi:hypothetical protein